MEDNYIESELKAAQERAFAGEALERFFSGPRQAELEEALKTFFEGVPEQFGAGFCLGILTAATFAEAGTKLAPVQLGLRKMCDEFNRHFEARFGPS